MTKTLPLAFLFALALTLNATALDVTVNLLNAKPGEWIRNIKADSHEHTIYVSDVTPEAVTVQLIHNHHHKVLSNKLVRIPVSYIKEKGIDPNAPGSRADSLEVKGKTYAVRVVKARSGDTEADYWISSEVPVTGILKKDAYPQNAARITTTYDEFGTEPIPGILHNTGTPTEANAEFGIPEPETASK